MSTSSRLGRIIGLLALAVALFGCSTVKLGYNTLGEIAYWWLHGYVDFSADQAPRVREDLARLHLWHRGHELARLADMLHRMEELAPGNVSPAQVCVFAAQLRERLNATAAQAEPALITLAMSLAPEQLRHLEQKYEANNAEYRKKWGRLTAGELAQKRYDEFLERSETFYGRLGEPQRAVLRRQVEHSAFDPRRELAERLRRQQDALQILRRISGEPMSFNEARGLLRGYLVRVQEPPLPDHRGYQHALIEEACRTFAGLHNSTNPAQREAAVRRLQGYQRDLRELAGRQ